MHPSMYYITNTLVLHTFIQHIVLLLGFCQYLGHRLHHICPKLTVAVKFVLCESLSQAFFIHQLTALLLPRGVRCVRPCVRACMCAYEWWTRLCSLSLSVHVQHYDFGNCAPSLHSATSLISSEKKKILEIMTHSGWKLFSSHFIYWTRQQWLNVLLKEAPSHIYAHDKKLLSSCINATICNELWFRRADIFARSTITSPTCEQTVFPHSNWLESISSTGASSRRF